MTIGEALEERGGKQGTLETAERMLHRGFDRSLIQDQNGDYELK